jgi:hypothetical protein
VDNLPPLEDADYEYLFMQLLEGVANGWQQPRAIGFFQKIRHRIRKSEWISWLDRFGQSLLGSPVPNYELAGRMVQLSQLECGEIGDIAGAYGIKLLNRQEDGQLGAEYSPILEFDRGSLDLLEIDDRFDDDDPIETGYRYDDRVPSTTDPDIPPELLAANPDFPAVAPPPASYRSQPEEAEIEPSEVREISIDEFRAMLHQDPDLVAQLAEQFNLNTNSPDVVFDAVIAQMQQQVQPISGDLSEQAATTPPPSKPIAKPLAPPSIPEPPAELDPW